MELISEEKIFGEHGTTLMKKLNLPAGIINKI